MHIVHVLTRLLRAGSEENTMATARWQANAGHRVTVLHGAEFSPDWYDTPVPGVDLRAVPQMIHPIRPWADLRAVRVLRDQFHALRPDVIHTHQSKAGVLGRLAAGAVPDALVVHGIHIIPFDGVGSTKRAFYVAAERLMARRTDVFIAVSESVARAYVEAGVCRADNVHCVYSGMPLESFRNGMLPDDWRKLLGIEGGNLCPPVVLMMAAFEPRKRHVPFLDAFRRVTARHPDVRLLLAGAGPEEGNVRAAVSRLGLDRNVVFCGHRPDPEALLALADLSVLTSEREGLPRVVVQSIAAGCPAVVSDLPGIGEIIEDGVNGWITDANDLGQTADLLTRLLGSAQHLSRLRAGARATDVSAWGLDALGARTTAIYEAAI